MSKITTIIGCSLAVAFLIGLGYDLNKINDDRVFDVLPVYILMAIAIYMMVYEAFFDIN